MHLAVPRPDGLVNFVSFIRWKIGHLTYQHCRHQVEKQRRKLIQSMLLDRTACVNVSESLVSDVEAPILTLPHPWGSLNSVKTCVTGTLSPITHMTVRIAMKANTCTTNMPPSNAGSLRRSTVLKIIVSNTVATVNSTPCQAGKA